MKLFYFFSIEYRICKINGHFYDKMKIYFNDLRTINNGSIISDINHSNQFEINKEVIILNFNIIFNWVT